MNKASFTIDKGQLVVILGPSGAGKTTCLNILGGMDSVTEGKVIVDESGKANGRGAYLKKSMEAFDKAEKTKILNRKLEVEVPDSIFEELKKIVGE